jgi:hypothetical protein
MSIDNPITQVIDLLKANGHNTAALEVEALARDLSNPNRAILESAVDGLVARCDVRWLGDLFIAEKNFVEWTRLLDKMANFVLKYK